MSKKESKGRQKIRMARIKNPSHRQVTFSKRRLGMFKKASEICTLCGVEAVIIVFSPGQKLFSFGHPNVESLIDRFLTRNPCPRNSVSDLKFKSDQQGSSIDDLNLQLTQILDLIEVERNRGDVLNEWKKCTQSQWWWEAPIGKLGLHELEVLNASIEDLKKNVTHHALLLEKNNSTSSILGLNNGDRANKIDGICLPQSDTFYETKFF